MKQKRKVGFFLGLILIVSMLVAVGGAPTVSKAVTTTTLSLQDQVTSLQNQILIQKLLALIAQLQAQLQQIIATKANPTIQCGWCGNSCINWTGKDRSSTVCADVMPPAGTSCQNVNGTCQITSTITKYSCSTVMGTIPSNNYSSCIPSANGTFNSLLECENSCPTTNASVTIISPKKGETWTIRPYGLNTIQWQSSGVNKVIIDLVDKSCSSETPMTLATNVPAIQGTYSWQLPNNFFESTANRYCAPYDNNPTAHYGWKSGDKFEIFIAELKSDNSFGAQDSSDEFTIVSSSISPSNCFDKVTGIGMTSEEAIAIAKAGQCGTTGSHSAGNDYCYSEAGQWVLGWNLSSPKAGCVGQCIVSVTNKTSATNLICPNLLPTISSIVPNKVSANTRVTIYGTNLSGATNVKFYYPTGQESASLGLPSTGSIVTPNSIEFTISGLFAYNSDAGTYQVKVVTPSGISNGINFTLLNSNTLTCEDSDKGLNYYIQGRAYTYTSANGGAYPIDSCCINTEDNLCGKSTGLVLNEVYCRTDNTAGFVKYTCPNGCENGACKVTSTTPLSVNLTATSCSNGNVTVTATPTGGSGRTNMLYNYYIEGTLVTASDGNSYTYTGLSGGSHAFNVTVRDSANAYAQSNTVRVDCPVTTSCTDSDNGNNPYVKGTITYNGQNYTDTYIDVCEESDRVIEHYCLNGEMRAVAFTCPSGYSCQDGACKYTSVTPTTVTIATKPTISCSWCGNQCVLSSTLVGIQCATVMPPTGSICALVNGVCTISNGGVVEGVETHIFSENLGYGMENDDVKILQSLLAQKSYFSGIVTGYFGWQTEEAVKAFQTANNISVTGLVGPLTRELLNK